MISFFPLAHQSSPEHRNSKGDFTMFLLTRQILAAVGAVVALTAPSMPADADELTQNLGPVGPREPILTWAGSKRVIAFYQPDSGNCAVHVVLWNPKDVNAESTAGFEVNLSPRQAARIDTDKNNCLDLQCGEKADSLAIVDVVVARIAE
jgi:hypothetical protein